MRKSGFVLFLGAFIATLSLGVFADGVRVTGDALLANVSGKKYTGTSSSGNEWESTYMKDGKYQVRLLNKDWSDSGTWEIKEDRVCSARTKRTYMCYELMRVSDDEYVWVDERGESSKSSGPK